MLLRTLTLNQKLFENINYRNEIRDRIYIEAYATDLNNSSVLEYEISDSEMSILI